MAVSAEEIPTLLLLMIALGISSYATVWIAGQLQGKISEVLK